MTHLFEQLNKDTEFRVKIEVESTLRDVRVPRDIRDRRRMKSKVSKDSFRCFK
jgi:hypothetical protein